jgi:two-component system OmpR family sensor kinase
MRPTNLVDTVRESVDACAWELGQDRVVVTAPRRVWVRADRLQLRSAIANVLRNALWYSPSDSEVRLDVSQQDGHATVRVTDRGPGVPAFEREHIFDPFMRGRAATPHRSGKGLGLFIARRVVEAHAGSIWVESGQGGATFCIRLPVKRDAIRGAGAEEEDGREVAS